MTTNTTDTLRKALEALEYHQAQTRPIHKTEEAIVMLRTILSQQAQEPQPVMYQCRARPTWKVDHAWYPWEECSAEAYEDHVKTPIAHSWEYEARKLYAAKPAKPAEHFRDVTKMMPAEQEKAYGFADFIREAKEKNLTIHDILPLVIKRCAEIEAEQQAPAITEQAPPLPEPYYPQWSHSNEFEAYTADQLRERDAMWAVREGNFLGELAQRNARSEQAPAVPHEPWVPYLVDRADGCKGRYAIARWHPDAYREVWNLRSHRWASASDDVLTLEQAMELMRDLVIPTAPTVPRDAIGKMLAAAMDEAVRNGANSISMPDEYVEIALWLSAAPAAPDAKNG